VILHERANKDNSGSNINNDVCLKQMNGEFGKGVIATATNLLPNDAQEHP